MFLFFVVVYCKNNISDCKDNLNYSKQLMCQKSNFNSMMFYLISFWTFYNWKSIKITFTIQFDVNNYNKIQKFKNI